MTAEEKIVQLFEQHKDLSVLEITKQLGVSKQLVHRILKRLTEQEKIQKLGLPPKTIYRIGSGSKTVVSKNNLSEEDKRFLKENFLLITETGEYLEGLDGFSIWCTRRKLPLEKTVYEFKETRKKYEQYINSEGLIDGTDKIKSTKGYEAIYLDRLFYLDFYTIERFGKTKLGTILHYAKQGQNKFLMTILLKEIKEKTERFIAKQKIEAVGFIPPTIKREVQLMKFLKNGFHLNIPFIEIQKISGIIPVPQKSLNKIEERINNADSTFALPENKKYNKILLIDDAIGSGATMNQIAKKIKEKGTAKTVIGLAIVGSFKGFDVITDV